ncbi:MAG TPA: T9SS type A sorting domain-containing protein, partial [Flavobacteriales bacterium]|nr:T9SS type A sorting domain-containing protein [Flavobacteriales bacterium]
SLCLSTDVLEPPSTGSGGQTIVFPSPATDHITVTSSGAITGINLIDVSGRSVALPFVVQGDRAAMDVSAFAPGAYTLQVLEGNNATLHALRFVIAR